MGVMLPDEAAALLIALKKRKKEKRRKRKIAKERKLQGLHQLNTHSNSPAKMTGNSVQFTSS
jgi:hypothetical protein